MRTWAAAAVIVAAAVFERPAVAEAVSGTLDRTAVRFYAPETGGTAYPRFIFERTLAFEARLAAMADTAEGIGDGYDERDVREALERHVAEEILSGLADRLIADLPPERRPSPEDLQSVEHDVARAFVEQLGGQARVDGAARAEHIEPAEVDAVVRRRTFAAWYIDRALTPILHPTEEQLRDVFRTSAHPFRGKSFREAHDALERWFVGERARAAESAFLQSARSRVHIIVGP
ncbi:MAG TPA: hypothetical protein VGM06_10435 [Polyangiaceae bacterium]